MSEPSDLKALSAKMHESAKGACSLYFGNGRGLCESCSATVAQHFTRKWADELDAALSAQGAIVMNELCRVLNPLVGAYCQLPAGHGGRHWGHGPTWTWDELTCESVVPHQSPPEASPARSTDPALDNRVAPSGGDSGQSVRAARTRSGPARAGRDAVGVVVFARGERLQWVTSLFNMSEPQTAQGWQPIAIVLKEKIRWLRGEASVQRLETGGPCEFADGMDCVLDDIDTILSSTAPTGDEPPTGAQPVKQTGDE